MTIPQNIKQKKWLDYEWSLIIYDSLFQGLEIPQPGIKNFRSEFQWKKQMRVKSSKTFDQNSRRKRK